MNFTFDSNSLVTVPKIELCSVDLKTIGFLSVSNLKIPPTYCELTEVSFNIYKGSNLYDAVTKYMTLKIDNIGLFEIAESTINSDGVTEYKEVKAYSYEVTLNNSTLSFKDNTVYALWDVFDLEARDKSILGIVSKYTGWSIKHIDASLLNQRRTLNIDNAEIYGFLVGDVSTAFKCYFVFDSIDKSISCYSMERDLTNSGINLSYRNLVEEIKMTGSSEDIITALTVTGAEGVGISYVNPLGGNVIYDFSYFKGNNAWSMPNDLQAAVNAWEEKIESKKETYENLVLNRKNSSSQIIDRKAELSVLKSELKSLQDLQSVAISAADNNRLAVIYNDIISKENEIIQKQNVISMLEAQYNNAVSGIANIVSELSFANNFTDEQYQSLKYYIKGSVYENENFVFTDTMTEPAKMEVSEQLYNQGLKILDKYSSPLYTFSVKVSNFMFSEKYQQFSKALELGVGVNLELEDNKWVESKVVQIILDYDDSENATIVLSDEYKLGSDGFIFSNKFNASDKASRKASLSSPLWDEPRNNGFYNTVTAYINNALNLATQEIINATNQEFTLGSYGLRGKKYDEETDSYDPHQVAMTNNVLAFTDDNWQSCKTALGKITLGEQDYYGLVAEAVVGNLIAGEQLTIMSSDKESFIVNADGATLKNADFTIENDVTRIILSPEDGFKIQRKKSDGTWEDVLSEDTSGGIIANNIKLESSNIGGWTTNKDGFSSPVGDYINSDGTGKLSLLSWNPTSATFAGNIYANNLNYRYGDGTVAYVFNNGTMGGGWLTDGSVTPAKLDRVYASEVYCDNLVAENIEAVNGRIDNLSSKFITTEVLEAGVIGTTDLIYGGKLYSGTPTNHTTLYTEMQYISTEAPNVASYVIETTGNIDVRSNVGSLKTNCPIIADNLTVSKPATFNQGFNITAGSVSGDFSFTGQITTAKESFIRDKMFICDTDLVVVHGEGAYYGVTQDVTIGDKTLYIKNGIIVGVG